MKRALPAKPAWQAESSGPATRADGAFDRRFLNNNLAEDLLEEVAAFCQGPFREDQIASTSEPKSDALSFESQVDRLYAIVMLAVDRVGNSQDGRKRRDQISLLRG